MRGSRNLRGVVRCLFRIMTVGLFGLVAMRAPAQPPPSDDQEAAFRNGAEQADKLVREGKPAGAISVVEPLLRDKALAESPLRGALLYYRGYASFMLRDYVAAGRALGQLAPFKNPVYGLHSCYLLARIHHLAGDGPEAAMHYTALLAGYDEQKKGAPERLARDPNVRDNPAEKARLESLVKGPAPDYVARASYYLATILYEDRRFAEAATRFAGFPQQFPKHQLVAEAQFRLGICQVQLKQFVEAIKNLEASRDDPQRSEQAMWWLARAQLGSADAKNPLAWKRSVFGAIDNLRRAAELARRTANVDAAAKAFRADVLIELADAQVVAERYAEAAASYQLVVSENGTTGPAQEAAERLAAAWQMAGDYAASDQACQRFVAACPRSPLLPAVLFRFAENASLMANAAFQDAKLPNRDAELARLSNEAILRYRPLLEKYPDFPQAAIARYGLAVAHYRLGQNEEAAAALGAIADAERSAELAILSYLQADCLLQALPADASDALAAARVLQDTEVAIKLLNAFLGSQPDGPQTADAMLKLGHCYRQMASVLADPKERSQTLVQAKTIFDSMSSKYNGQPMKAMAVFGRAACLIDMGDFGSAVTQLQRFLSEPFVNHPIAPLALVRLSILNRSQGQAAAMLAQGRSQYEAGLMADPDRKNWAPWLEYHQALALKDSGKLSEARGIFDDLRQRFSASPEALDATWQAAQCRRIEVLASANRDDPQFKKQLVEMGQSLLDSAARLSQESYGSQSHQRLLYEAAWCLRSSTLPDSTSSASSIPAGEDQARQAYVALIAAGSESRLSVDARFELADLLAEREQYAAALELLNAASTMEPSPELAERIVLRMADCQLGLNQSADAMARYDSMARNEKSPLRFEARLRAGECAFRQREWNKAIEQLLPFRDQGPLQKLPGVSDRALLRLGQAQVEANQKDAARQTFQKLVERFPSGIWAKAAQEVLADLK